MKKLLAQLFLALMSLASLSQPTTKLTSAQLREDLVFLRNQLFSAHADAFTEITKTQYEDLFKSLDTKLDEPMTVIDFFKVIKPAVANLSDEHAEISLPKELEQYDERPFFLPFSLEKKNNHYVIASLLSTGTGLKAGDIIEKINGVPVNVLIAKNVTYATGYPDQRAEKALSQFGYLYTISNPFDTSFNITTSSKTLRINGITYPLWHDHLTERYGKTNCDPLLSYRKIGYTGYINACSFGARGADAFNRYGRAADSLFELIKRDDLKQVIIDVSKNSGGNSALGNFLLRQFYDGSYNSYRMNWRRSDEYLNTIKGWGVQNPAYEQMKPGEVMQLGGGQQSIEGVNDLYKGKVYILVGSGTFSSAIMFATIIKDNKLATLIGETPKDGHPTHFGEMYGVTLPHSKLEVRFGVKEWIRPLGKEVGNKLLPDIEMSANGSPEEIVKRLTEMQNHH